MERVGDTVRRPLYPWSPSVHDLLLHLERIGFPYSPRFLGLDDEGREVLTYLEGESGGTGWTKVAGEAGLRAMARLLRDFHDAVRDHRPATAWAAHDGTFGAGEFLAHGDFGPWNLVWRGTTPIGILDWDYVWPAPPLHDVAYALEYVAPFRDDDFARDSLHHREPPDRRRRLEIFAEAYGLSSTAGLADEVIAAQELVLRRVERLAAAGHQPHVTWQQTGVLARSAAHLAWSRSHRALFA
ncbi:aminoglycoside phosphotransferase family protein [Cryptosporangium phraense]|uniref:Aminoglycoside phosphotransferase family protein n=1 Tax=Cryptosporangium phraense TaxID=2593070 RepID=A0A545ARW7_9ACTN|nr:aminoglycoside phosphotransferase family protein [Cryptosporangium phraense]TQS44086.1 aminoglycoside phosphotransferase family protein [Cryptosporangium phraense]